MSINLQNGQKIDLIKGNPNLTKLLVGLGWDAAVQTGKKGGVLCVCGYEAEIQTQILTVMLLYCCLMQRARLLLPIIWFILEI